MIKICVNYTHFDHLMNGMLNMLCENGSQIHIAHAIGTVFSHFTFVENKL